MPSDERAGDEVFTNPMAPPGMENTAYEREKNNLTNADFRRLMMTPRAPAMTPSLTPAITPVGLDAMSEETPKGEHDKESAAERRRRKKIYYAKLKRAEENTMAELAKKYRDRAKERRTDDNPDYTADDPSMQGGYRAVAPDAQSGFDAAERRRQMIQESKFLGGDMEHTHLVKGLDYALLQKVRSEITNIEKENEEELERITKENKNKADEEEKQKQQEARQRQEEEESMQFRTRFARNIYRTVFKCAPAERNDLFIPGRLAYVVELDDEFAETDIPTTLLRSVADCPNFESSTPLTTNDLVIQKLTETLAYLRQGRKGKKKKEKKKDDDHKGKTMDESIYGDLGDYVPEKKSDSKSAQQHHTGHKRDSYFDSKPQSKEPEAERKPDGEYKLTWNDVRPKGGGPGIQQEKLMTKLAGEPKAYAECYPGLVEMNDAIEDSDDEVDYSKMDMGNKKGPIGRWDFDTQEEYSDYMSNKEALPKAAFQYGVKMSDGRKTRRINKGEKNEKQKLDQEWSKIQNIISKRKNTEDKISKLEKEYKIPKM